MSKIIIMQGLPASGKSTRAEEIVRQGGDSVRINKDLIREMLHFGRFTHRNEANTHGAAHALARFFLGQGVSVVIDDTNLNPKTREGWVALAKELGAKIEYERMDTKVEECVRRDMFRDKKVGKHVIVKMAMQRMNYGAGKPTAIFDLDGTLCDIGHRLHHVRKDPKDWKAFFEGIPDDKVREDVLRLLKWEWEEGRQIVLVSARPEDYREQTERWLKREGIEHGPLIMRESGDKRPDTEVKADIFDKYLKHLDIVRVYDDRPSVIRMWEGKGLEVVDVGEGVEF